MGEFLDEYLDRLLEKLVIIFTNQSIYWKIEKKNLEKLSNKVTGKFSASTILGRVSEGISVWIPVSGFGEIPAEIK